MSYDIYGNHLRKGYCEVHPNVHEEYPCSLCLAEGRNKQLERDNRQQPSLADYHEVHIESLQAQLTAKDALISELADGLRELKRFTFSIRPYELAEARAMIDTLIEKATTLNSEKK